MKRNNQGQFMKGNTPHNKGKNKESYEPLRRTSEKLKIEVPKEIKDALKKKICCECGCSQEIIIKRKHRWTGVPEYIQGHHNKIKHPMLGKHHTKKSKEKIKQKNLGEHHSPETEFKKRDLRLIGKNNPNWHGGISFEPYDEKWNNLFKRRIRKRDNQICMLCGIHREKLNRALDVHHINYDKKLTLPQNCISLCSSCNIKANFNRKHWTKFFQDLLSEKYGYKYVQEKCMINIS